MHFRQQIVLLIAVCVASIVVFQYAITSSAKLKALSKQQTAFQHKNSESNYAFFKDPGVAATAETIGEVVTLPGTRLTIPPDDENEGGQVTKPLIDIMLSPAATRFYLPEDKIMEATFARRREKVRNVCHKHYQQDPAKFEINRMPANFGNIAVSKSYITVDRQNRLLFCRIPKVSSTAWKKLLIALGNTSLADDNYAALTDALVEDDSVQWPNLVKLSELDSKQLRYVLDTYTKVMFVRDPINRFLATWRDKLSGMTFKTQSEKLVGLVSRKLLSPMLAVDEENENTTGLLPAPEPKKTPEALGSAEPQNISLKEFFIYIWKYGYQANNVYWNAMHTHCLSCLMQYNYIAKYEEFDTEGRYIISRMIGKYQDGNREWQLPVDSAAASEQANFTVTGIDVELENLPPDLIKAVANRYAIDFDMFGYPIDRYTKIGL